MNWSSKVIIFVKIDRKKSDQLDHDVEVFLHVAKNNFQTIAFKMWGLKFFYLLLFWISGFCWINKNGIFFNDDQLDVVEWSLRPNKNFSRRLMHSFKNNIQDLGSEIVESLIVHEL